MKYILSWSVPCETYDATITRFLKTGAPPPEGVELLGRWHGMDGRGFAIAETSDAKALFHYRALWADLLPFTITPCVEDAEAGEVLSSLTKG